MLVALMEMLDEMLTEDEATDRAHRIGQGKPVFSYRLIVAGSVEEKMLALQARKRELAEGISTCCFGLWEVARIEEHYAELFGKPDKTTP